MPSKIETVGQRIRRIRKELAMDQEPFGRHLGVGQGTVSAWERDDKKRAPSAEAFFRLATIAPQTDDQVFFLERAGLNREIIGRAAEKLIGEQITRPEGIEMILVPRVRKTPQGLEPVGEPLMMPPETIANPLSTYCFVLDEIEAVVDTTEAESAELMPFWGKPILVEFSPENNGPWPKGVLCAGVLHGPHREILLGRVDWNAEFVPIGSLGMEWRSIVVGTWTEGKLAAPRTSEGGRITTAAEVKAKFICRAKENHPRLPSEPEAEWESRAYKAEERDSKEKWKDLIMKFAVEEAERIKYARQAVRIPDGCKILGRMIAWFPSKAEAKV